MQITKCRRNNAKASLLQNRNANFKTTKYERKNKYEAQTPAKNLSRGAENGDSNDVKSSDNHIHPLKTMYEMMAMMAMGPIKATTTM